MLNKIKMLIAESRSIGNKGELIALNYFKSLDKTLYNGRIGECRKWKSI